MNKIRNTSLALMLAMLVLCIILLLPIIRKVDEQGLANMYSFTTYFFTFIVKDSIFAIVYFIFYIMIFILGLGMLIILYARPEKRIMIPSVMLVGLSHILTYAFILIILANIKGV